MGPCPQCVMHPKPPLLTSWRNDTPTPFTSTTTSSPSAVSALAQCPFGTTTGYSSPDRPQQPPTSIIHWKVCSVKNTLRRDSVAGIQPPIQRRGQNQGGRTRRESDIRFGRAGFPCGRQLYNPGAFNPPVVSPPTCNVRYRRNRRRTVGSPR